MKIAVLIIVLFSLCTSQEYAIRSFTALDGLATNYITTLHQDSKGYLWIGTDDGFSVFDGSTFRNVLPEPNTLWGFVNDFFESTSDTGVMWVATNGGGLIRYAHGSYTRMLVDTLPAANRVNDVYQDKHGVLWMTTDNGFYRYEKNTFTRIPLSASHARECLQILPFDDDVLWVSSPEGIVSFSAATLEVKPILTAKINGANDQMFRIKRTGRVVVIGVNTLWVLNGSHVVGRLPLTRGWYGNGSLDTEGNLWASSTECIHFIRVSGDTPIMESTFDRTNGIPVNGPSAVLCDRENNIWIATYGKGIARLQDPGNVRFSVENLHSRGTIDSKHRIWVPTKEGFTILEQRPDRSWRKSSIPVSSVSSPVSIQFTGADTFWCTTTNNRLMQYRVRYSAAGSPAVTLLNQITTISGFSSVYPIVLFKDSRGYLWSVWEKGGLIIIDPRSIHGPQQVFHTYPGLPSMTMAAFAETKNGRIYCGGLGGNGLLEFEYINGKYRFATSYRYDSLISSYGIRSLAVSPDGSLWIGTRYDGMIRRFPNGALQQFIQGSGLHSRQINSLYFIDSSLWIGTQSGLEFIPDYTAPRFIRSSELTTSPVYTIGAFRDRSVWTMTAFEVSVNDPATLMARIPLPPIYLLNFNVNGIPQQQNASLEFIRNDLISCSFTYTAVTLRGNTDVKYQYRLEGLHTDWQGLTSERSVTFANLGAGEYTFVVRAVLNNGERVTDSVRQSFVIVPALWDRWWFAPLILSVILSVVGGITVLRIRQRFALEKIRVSIAADLHDDIGSVLARIANLADILVVYSSTKRSTTVRKKGTVRKRSVKPSLPEANAQTIADLSRGLMEKMSDVVWSVNPDNDDPKKLTERLQTYCTEIAENHRMQVNFSADGVFDGRSIDPQKTRAALLIVKESLANILKHSDATTIELSVQILPKRWSITIADNGVGFNEDELPRVNGIFNMRSRATACGGEVQITSSEGNGTSIRLEIPL